MRGWLVAALIAAGAVVSGCTTVGSRADSSWAEEADGVVAEMAAAYDIADAYQTARFYSAGGTLDLSIWERGVATTPVEVVRSIEQLWFFEPGRAHVTPEHLFVSPDGALVWWYGYDGGGVQDWVQSYAFGANGRTASRAFRAVEGPPYGMLTPTETVVVDLVDRYVAAWDGPDPAALAAVFADNAVVRDDTLGLVWRGREELSAAHAATLPMDKGPWPGVFVYEVGDHVEAIALVQPGEDCPALRALRWVLDGDRILYEVRFTHVPSARRCATGLPDGWWTSFELPPELQDNVTEIVDVGGSPVELVNAEPSHEAYARWLFGRFVESGIGMPEVAAVWFPPSPECAELGGLAIEADERYEGRHTVVACFAADRLASETSESGWSTPPIAYGLHELAHIWMVDQLDDRTRTAFNELAGLSVWRGVEAAWRDRGVEHAAFTIAWGLAGTADARYPILPPPACETLAARFELLTGHQPITSCGEGGWSQ